MKRFKSIASLALALLLSLSGVRTGVYAEEGTDPEGTGDETTEVAPAESTEQDGTPEGSGESEPEQTPADDPQEPAESETDDPQTQDTQETPAEKAAAEDAPAENAPAEATATDDAPVEDTQAEADESAESNGVHDYDTFLLDLKNLQEYAGMYSSEHTEYGSTELVLNYVRCGVEKYADATWSLVAGPEITDFTSFVAEKDKKFGTSVEGLRNLDTFTIPNGQTVEFRHMFGTMNITWYQRTNKDYALTQADMGGWAGDVCDLLSYTNGKVSVAADADEEAINKAADEIRTKYLGVDEPDVHTFGILDIYGDLDAYYFMHEMMNDSTVYLAQLMEGYYVSGLTDAKRADYFMTNRLSGTKTKAGVRRKLYDAYTSNSMIKTLEQSRDLAGDDLAGLRKACIYAWADYLTALAGDENAPGTDPDNPVNPDNPDPDDPDEPGDNNGLDVNKYYTEFSRNVSTLAPGVEQRISYAMSADDKQMVYYTATIDIARDDVSVYANYKDNTGKQWGTARVTDQIASAVQKHTDPSSDSYIANYNPVVGVNADFFNITTGAPSGALVMEGVTYQQTSNGENWFGILDDETPVIGGTEEWNTYKDRIREAVGGGAYLVRDGKVSVGSSSDYYNSRASRTCVGITKDGKVVLMVLDGRQEPFSCGGSAQEIAQIMLDAGCVNAINLDGGGSTTFAAKEEGSDAISIVNRPSDGYERSVSSSLFVVSTAEPSDEFDHALISADNDVTYLTTHSSLQLHASGVNNIGGPADLPEGTAWNVADQSVGSVSADGQFTAAAAGTTDVQLLGTDGSVLGTITMHVVTPDALAFEKDNLTAVYEATIPLSLTASYKGNKVAISPEDVTIKVNPSAGGTVDGFQFTACKEEAGYRNVTVTASLNMDLTISATTAVSIYSQGEAVFDFDNADGGDRNLAWVREVSNSDKTKEGDDGNTTDVYHAIDPDEPMDVSYVFAMDMREIPVPEKLKNLIGLVAGGDTGNVTPWRLLLQLAGRVSELTEVDVNIKIDPEMDLDYSGLKIVTDYFHLDPDATTFDEASNTLKAVIKWDGDESEPIDQADANPIVIVSGLKLTPKKDAAWDDANRLHIETTGDLSYDIYLAASALYTDNFQSYGLYKYDNSQDGTKYVADGSHLDKGAHFRQDEFRSFSDSFILDKTNRNGWYEVNDKLYYYEDNKPLTGIKEVPGYKDADRKYYYQFDENGVCIGKMNGLFDLDGNKYYAIGGELKKGWRYISTEGAAEGNYYFDPETGAAYNGTQKVNGHTQVFENYVLVDGEWTTDANGNTKLWYMDKYMYREFVTIRGNTYYFDYNQYMAKGITYVRQTLVDNAYYLFDQNGHWLQNFTGLYEHNDFYYYVVNGVLVYDKTYAGLVKFDGAYQIWNDDGAVKKELTADADGDYYYVNTKGRLANAYGYVYKTNDLLPAGYYTFDHDTYLLTDTKPETEKNGIVIESDGEYYYYKDGRKTYGGLLKYEGTYEVTKADGTKETLTAAEGGDYYYACSGGNLSNKYGYVSKTNGLLPEGYYTFDSATRKMVRDTDPSQGGGDEPAPAQKNGIVIGSDGEYYWYVNDVKTYGGLLKFEGTYEITKADGTKETLTAAEGGDYYYACSRGNLSNKYGYVYKANGLLPAGYYTFDSTTRKMVRNTDPSQGGGDEPAPAQKNGIVIGSDGGYYWYVNNAKTYGGLLKFTGTYEITLADGSKQTMTADADGDYYYACTKGNLSNKYGYVSKTNGLLKEGYYTFDSTTRKMVRDTDPSQGGGDEPAPTPKNGIVIGSDGVYYWYVNDVKTYGGLLKFEGTYEITKADGTKETLTAAEGGDYYYACSRGNLSNKYGYVSKTNGLLPEGYYTFDSTTRKMVRDTDPSKGGTDEPAAAVKNGVYIESDGEYYYYKDGKKTYGGLLKFEGTYEFTKADGSKLTLTAAEDGDYYYACTKGNLSKTYGYVSKTYGLIKEGYHTFDSVTRKMVD